jgi:hypothetical protein
MKLGFSNEGKSVDGGSSRTERSGKLKREKVRGS